MEKHKNCFTGHRPRVCLGVMTKQKKVAFCLKM